MRTPTILNSIALTLTLSVVAVGNENGASSIEGAPLADTIRSAHGVVIDGASTLGLGPDYRARFTATGLEFTPAFGREVETTHPVTFTLDSIHRGGLLVHRATATAPVAGERHVEYARGGNGPPFVERYDVRADGVELSYTFAARPPGDGDLVVRLRVSTDLAPSVIGSSPEGLTFTLEDRGGVSIGAVTGVGADGATAAGSLRYDGAYLDLVLPAGFVDRARYPMTLDPLIGSAFDVATGYDDMHPDVAYDASTARYCVVWQREFAGDSVDIRGVRLSTAGAPVGSLFAVVSDTAVSLNPAIANVNMRDRFLVVWQTGPTVFGPWDIVGRSVDAATAAVSTTVTIASNATIEQHPDVGGEAIQDDDALVIWDEDGVGIKGAEVTIPSSGNPFVFSTFSLSAEAGYYDGEPAIAKSGGSSGNYVAVWTRDFGTQTDIRGAVVDRNGTILDSYIAITNTADDESSPDVDGDGTNWVVAYEADESGSLFDHDIWAVPVTYAGGAGVTGTHVIVEGDNFDDEVDPAVAFLGPKTLVAWSDEVPSLLRYDLGMRAIDPATCGFCGIEVNVVSGDHIGSPKIAAQRSGAAVTGDQALVVYFDANLSPPFDGDVSAQLFEAVGAGGGSVNIGGGCGAGGTLTATGNIAQASAFKLNLNGADPTAKSSYLNINLPSTPIPCGSCKITPLLLLLPIPISGGSQTILLPIPCDATLANLTVEAQWLVQGTPTNPCISLQPGLAFSNRLQFTIGY